MNITDGIKSIISSMTLEEKTAQLGCIEAKDLVDENNRFSPEKAEMNIKNGIGQVAGVAYTLNVRPDEVRELTIQIQKWIKENTRMKIPVIFHEECLSGLASKCSPIYPHPIGLGSMWEPELVNRMTDNTRKLMRGVGVHQGLSPVLDIASDPRWGRNEETYGEDTYLVAKNAIAFISGLQGKDHRKGIISTAKHFAGHGQTEGGRNCSPVHIGPRELRDNVLFPYEAAVREGGIKSVMNAYHDIDGIPCAASKELLTGILREEWGFDGIVVSDYFAIERLISHHATTGDKKYAAKQAIEAGIDVELPYLDCFGNPLIDAVTEGIISEKVIDTALERHLKIKYEFGLFEDDVTSVNPMELYKEESNINLALELARKSIVLLKNEGDILPLNKKIRNVAVIGPNAASKRNLLGSYTYMSLNEHFGSPESDESPKENFTGREIVDILEAIKNKLGSGSRVRYAKGCDIIGKVTKDFAESVAIAEEADVAIIVVGDKAGMFEGGTSGEGIDRVCTGLYGVQEDLVKAVAATGTPIVLVLVNGRPLTIRDASEKAQAIVEAWLPGEQGGNAVADVLFGDYNPGGKLPVSLLKSQGQHPLMYNIKKVNFHKRYLDEDMKPLYPFGHGLNYTSFMYTDLSVSPESSEGRGAIKIGLNIKNTGGICGEEVVQLYVNDVIASLPRPIKELKGFKRLALESGEQKKVEFTLYTDQLAFHNKNMKLAVEPGKYIFLVGSSSEDIRLEGEFELSGDGYEVNRNERKYFSL